VSAKRTNAANGPSDCVPAPHTLCAAIADAVVAVSARICCRSRRSPHHLVRHVVPRCHDNDDADRIGGDRLGFCFYSRDLDRRRYDGASANAICKSAICCRRHQHSRRDTSTCYNPHLGQLVGAAVPRVVRFGLKGDTALEALLLCLRQRTLPIVLVVSGWTNRRRHRVRDAMRRPSNALVMRFI
jgi:hypothetical protein